MIETERSHKHAGIYALDTLNYALAIKNASIQPEATDLPSLWLVALPLDANFAEDDSRVNSVPYLTPTLEYSPGRFTISYATTAKRKFIVSSGFSDAVTGAKPTYLDVYFYPWTLVSTAPISPTSSILCMPPGNRSLSTVACGSVQLQEKHGHRLSAVTQRQLKDNEQGSYCQVTEDYRESSAFEVLGSIGGLLALLQGIHIFLFGRPLFWGMFGAKLLSPFGLVGRLAGENFRRRLLEHYHAPDIRTNQADTGDASSTIRMNRFLLDYVLDMGPAAIPPGPERRPDDVLGFTHAGVELEDLQQHNSSRRPQSGEHTQKPFLDVDGSDFGSSSLEVCASWPGDPQSNQNDWIV
ncbi:hypothetical protein FRC08_001844 [Ceratobasidium sp. 394]|nr:hypothetical protein FRC08_001844 [Ceratobasidium sp. 394]